MTEWVEDVEKERDRLRAELFALKAYRDGFNGRVEALLQEGQKGWSAAERLRGELRALKQGLAAALLMLDAQAPEPSHKGPCGPEAGCDGACMDTAYYEDAVRPLRRLAR